MVSLDKKPTCKANLCVDVMEWDYKRLPVWYFDLMAPSPPCQEYSAAKRTGGERDLLTADSIVQRTLDIFNYFQPPVWWLENPSSWLLKDREVVQGLPFVDLD